MSAGCSVYEYTSKTRFALPSISCDRDIMDVAPQLQWNYELPGAAGEAKFRPIVVEAKAIAERGKTTLSPLLDHVTLSDVDGDIRVALFTRAPCKQ
ncbi:hypothetical protein BS47DRAFT_1338848 [Hydnum rufescens UP504]|uniref:Uncharacterized protein n=1 Tax=Hydnum rufescens UP504 TaxID=1448309 RepID=A0A9P6B623_9AGAM|nr:hypothetical protein BS47DRAFT_1338848 [Hydnum rufescens UP504]